MTPHLAQSIEHWSLERLVPYVRNPRTHAPEQVAQIAASIAEFGFTNPILVGADGIIIAGHGRLAAARQLGLERVPVIQFGHLSETQRRALVLADNQLALNAGWDEELLRLELEGLKVEGFDLALTGFDTAFLDELLAPAADDAGIADQEPPEPPETPISQPGDLWLCGRHRVLCADATHPEDYERLLDGEKARMTFTDPPYNVNYANSAKDAVRGTHRPILNDNLGEDFGAFLTAACRSIVAHTDGAVYIAMSSSELDTLQAAFREAGGHWSTFIIWAKNTFTMGRADYQRQYEPILDGWPEGAKRHWCGARDQGDVWFIDRPRVNDLHPTMKPLELVERAVRNSTETGDLVLDPFGGSGSTLMAASLAGRRCATMELDPRYVDVIVRRWQEAIGETATHADTGRAFGED